MKKYCLREVCSYITDGSHGSPKSVDIGLPMASVKDLTPFGICFESCRNISKEDFLNLVKQGCKPIKGDVLIAKDGNSALDTVCEIKEDVQVVLLSSVAILRPDQSIITPTYLRYYLDCDSTRKYIKSGFITGAAIPRVVLEDFKKVIVTIPPLPTQQKIAAILSAYDDLIENNTRRIKILEEMAQALYREWFVNFRFPGREGVRMVESELGLVPEGWEVRKLGDIAEEVRRNVEPNTLDSDTPYFGLEHIPRKSIALSDWGFAKDVQSTKHQFFKGEILFGKIRPYFHKVGVAPVDGVCSSDAIVIRPKKPEYFGLVLFCVSSEDFVNHATQTSQGTKMPRANWNVLVNYPVIIPPKPLLDEFNNIASDMVDLIITKIFQNANLHRTRDLLLPKLISGELDVSELDIRIPEAEA